MTVFGFVVGYFILTYAIGLLFIGVTSCRDITELHQRFENLEIEGVAAVKILAFLFAPIWLFVVFGMGIFYGSKAVAVGFAQLWRTLFPKKVTVPQARVIK